MWLEGLSGFEALNDRWHALLRAILWMLFIQKTHWKQRSYIGVIYIYLLRLLCPMFCPYSSSTKTKFGAKLGYIFSSLFSGSNADFNHGHFSVMAVYQSCTKMMETPCCFSAREEGRWEESTDRCCPLLVMMNQAFYSYLDIVSTTMKKKLQDLWWWNHSK